MLNVAWLYYICIIFYAFAIIVDSDGVTTATAAAAAADGVTVAPSPLSFLANPHSLIFFHTLILHSVRCVGCICIAGLSIVCICTFQIFYLFTYFFRVHNAKNLYNTLNDVFASLSPIHSSLFLGTLFCCVCQKKMWVCIKFLRWDEQHRPRDRASEQERNIEERVENFLERILCNKLN